MNSTIKNMALISKLHGAFQWMLWRLGIIIDCHQRPERSFFLDGRQIPICARCLGLVSGSALFPLYCHDMRLAATLMAAMLLDGGTQALHLRESRNWLRFITGMGFAIGCGGLILRVIAKLWNI